MTLTPTPDGTEIAWRSSFTAKIPGTGPAIRRRLTTFIADLARSLAAAAERQAPRARPTDVRRRPPDGTRRV